MRNEIDLQESGKIYNIFLLTFIRTAVCFLLAGESDFVLTAARKKKMIYKNKGLSRKDHADMENAEY